ncbi:hypothetical protein GWI33_011239, partial [Rhynchophorus ferrugineus]
MKSFLVKVELTIRKLSCPGVWLCSNGKVSMQLGMLDSNIQTDAYKPSFPVVFDEKFIFYKTFVKERRLSELQRTLNREQFFVELIQWKNCDEGVVLASFRTTLDDLLYSNSSRRPSMTGTDIDLLLEPTKLFPGTISPKLAIKTKTTIEETFCDAYQRPSMTGYPRYPCAPQTLSRKLHPKKVCHTVGYSKAQQRCSKVTHDKRPIFRYQKPEDDLILRTNPNKVMKDDVIKTSSFNKISQAQVDLNDCPEDCDICYCNSSGPLKTEQTTKTSFVRSVKTNKGKSSTCTNLNDNVHQPYYCPICSKYECTFSQSRRTPELSSENDQENLSYKFCPYCGENYEKQRGWTLNET